MSAQSVPDPDPNKVISLQVGEMCFCVSYETFQKLEGADFKKKVLYIEPNKYFVDRDGKMFEYILRYLRNEIISFPENFKDGRMLLQEAKFFGLSKLQVHLSNGAGKPEVITLLAMFPFEQANPYRRQFHQERGMEISLHWMGAKSNGTDIFWKDLLQACGRKITFPAYEVKGISSNCNTVGINGSQFYSELERNQATVDKPYIANVKDFTCVSILLNGFISVGFTLLMDRSSDNVKCFNKNYRSVTEFTLRRIRPIWN